ncbi:hypothetical protein D3C86_993810 [compost metagenome]
MVAGVAIELMHLVQPQMVETQQLHRNRIALFHGRRYMMHDIGNAHQAALELPTVDRRRHPFLAPEHLAHQRCHRQHRNEHATGIEAQIVASRRAEQSHRRRGQHHRQRQKDQGNDDRAAPGLLPVGLGVHRLDFEHCVGFPELQW